MGSSFLEENVHRHPLEERTTNFEAAMVANERYRHAAFYEMCILYGQIAMESTSTKLETSKKFASQSLEFFKKPNLYAKSEDQERFRDIAQILQSILDNKIIVEDIKRGLAEIKDLDAKMKETFDSAKSDYYKILT